LTVLTVLIVKTSSMGDVIHTFPAVTDAARARPGIRFDWAVEEGLAELPGWHPAVESTIPVALRRWRRPPRRGLAGELRAFRTALRARRYDAVIDAQGLYKSAAIAVLARGRCHGFDIATARERLAPLAYGRRHRIDRSRHAIDRVRALFAAALGYPVPDGSPDYGLDPAALPTADAPAPYLAFLHGTTWPTKLWPVARWRGLAALAGRAGLAVCLPGPGGADLARAEAIADGLPHVRIVETPTLSHAAGLIAGAAGAAAVDTGLGHLAAALGVPAVSLYGPTTPDLVGTRGPGQAHLVADLPCAPCRSRACRIADSPEAPPPCLDGMDAAAVWARLEPLLRLAPAAARRAGA
jgi:heptosyltransferase-1